MARTRITIGFTKQSVKHTTRKVDAFVLSKRKDIEALIRKYVLLIWNEVQATVPVDTGFLRSTIETDLRGLANKLILYGEVKTTRTTYAHYVEFGTVRMAAQPYMRPAYMRHEPGFIRELQALVKKPA